MKLSNVLKIIQWKLNILLVEYTYMIVHRIEFQYTFGVNESKQAVKNRIECLFNYNPSPWEIDGNSMLQNGPSMYNQYREMLTLHTNISNISVIECLSKTYFHVSNANIFLS